MKTEKNILVAFLLNVIFSAIEFIGGFLTGSIAIISDAIHDFGDALSIGLSFFLEKKSKQKPDKKYTYGYQRYSVLGALITTLILVGGECLVIYNSIQRFINPVEVNHDGMLIFAVFGVLINSAAAFVTREGDSLNQKSVNLHMLEDVLGWVVVLIGSILIKITNIDMIDNIMSIGVAIFLVFQAVKNFKEILDLFLVKTPKNINLDKIKKHLKKIDGVLDVHHIHAWSINGENVYATLHIKTDTVKFHELKEAIREELKEHGISHATIEIEDKDDDCEQKECKVEHSSSHGHHHHHH